MKFNMKLLVIWLDPFGVGYRVSLLVHTQGWNLQHGMAVVNNALAGIDLFSIHFPFHLLQFWWKGNNSYLTVMHGFDSAVSLAEGLPREQLCVCNFV